MQLSTLMPVQRLRSLPQRLLLRKLTLAGAALLAIQFSLGVLNVVLHLPLVNAVAHNFVAANLLMVLVVIFVQLRHSSALHRSATA